MKIEQRFTFSITSPELKRVSSYIRVDSQQVHRATACIQDHGGIYLVGGVGSAIIYLLAAIELAVILAFLFGFVKQWSYGLVLLMHAVSTLSSYNKYLPHSSRRILSSSQRFQCLPLALPFTTSERPMFSGQSRKGNDESQSYRCAGLCFRCIWHPV
jgi:hypothetical protein